MHKSLSNIIKIGLPLILGGTILYWMYRGFDFRSIQDVLFHQMDWTWMLLSFPFGIMAQVFRGWRWKQTLEPVGEHPRTSTAVYSIFISYAISFVIPRIGEVGRCGILKRYDRVSFSKALGTVVTERIVDMLLMLLITVTSILLQIHVFGSFFSKTGTRFNDILAGFTTAGWIVTVICAIAVLILGYFILRQFTIYNKVKEVLRGIWQGIFSLKKVKNIPLFIFYSVAIWASYFLHYYLTFFCFDFTADLGLSCALVTFVVGSIAVIVPTPNGAGPWHFAVKTMLILYGVADTQALYFVLIVHTVQSLLVILMGVYASAALALMKRREEQTRERGSEGTRERE
jgi:uncharacterized protein (TIRG00374 family)